MVLGVAYSDDIRRIHIHILSIFTCALSVEKISISNLTLCRNYHLCFRNRVYQVPNIEELYDSLMSLILKLANCGVIHGDFNEFNIMLTKNDCVPIIIDFPQMISINHLNAEQ